MGNGNLHALKAWRIEQKLKLDACAAAVGTVRQVWYDWEGGRRVPSPRFMTEIYRFTEGAVSPNDFYELPPIGQMQLPITETPAPLFDVQERSAPPELQAAA